jgi:hypothetical protein
VVKGGPGDFKGNSNVPYRSRSNLHLMKEGGKGMRLFHSPILESMGSFKRHTV